MRHYLYTIEQKTIYAQKFMHIRFQCKTYIDFEQLKKVVLFRSVTRGKKLTNKV